MTANTGRTTSKWVTFSVDNSAGTLTQIPVDSINGVGLTYEEVDVTAFQDAIRGALPGTPTCTIEITGPFDTTATTGSHTVLYNLAGGVTPLAMSIAIGIRHAWDTEPVFGITGTTANGFLCRLYEVDVNNGKYRAVFGMYPGSAAPAWGTAAYT